MNFTRANPTDDTKIDIFIDGKLVDTIAKEDMPRWGYAVMPSGHIYRRPKGDNLIKSLFDEI